MLPAINRFQLLCFPPVITVKPGIIFTVPGVSIVLYLNAVHFVFALYYPGTVFFGNRFLLQHDSLKRVSIEYDAVFIPEIGDT